MAETCPSSKACHQAFRSPYSEAEAEALVRSFLGFEAATAIAARCAPCPCFYSAVFGAIADAAAARATAVLRPAESAHHAFTAADFAGCP